jgi:hypothetical protein
MVPSPPPFASLAVAAFSLIEAVLEVADVGDDAGDVAMPFNHLLVMAAALARGSGEDPLAEHHVYLYSFLYRLLEDGGIFLKEVHVGHVFC